MRSTWPSPEAGSPPTQAIALGLGSLFNHSTLHQNIGWKRVVPEQCLIYTSLRDIHEGEELCISYGGQGVLWFEDADAEEIREAERRQDVADMAEGEQGEIGLGGLLRIDWGAEEH
jgi:SET domain-containing protein